MNYQLFLSLSQYYTRKYGHDKYYLLWLEYYNKIDEMIDIMQKIYNHNELYKSYI